MELSREVLASRREEVLDTLAELTMLAVEDRRPPTSGGRWVNLISDRQAVIDSLHQDRLSDGRPHPAASPTPAKPRAWSAWRPGA